MKDSLHHFKFSVVGRKINALSSPHLLIFSSKLPAEEKKYIFHTIEGIGFDQKPGSAPGS